MDSESKTEQEYVNQLYEYTARRIVTDKTDQETVKQELTGKGLSSEVADVIVNNVGDQVRSAKKVRANKNMIYGALWCIGGTIATLADIGYIFWGAIVFGAVQFFIGVADS